MKKGYSKILVNDYAVPNQGAVWPQSKTFPSPFTYLTTWVDLRIHANPPTAALDWELMASLGARHRTEDEHKALYEGAGLKITGIWRHPSSLDSLIELELA
jgi:hypothetical protein